MLTAHRAGKKHLSSKFAGGERVGDNAPTSLETVFGALHFRFPFSAGLQLFYGTKQPGKGLEQNPRQQKEGEKEESKAEVAGNDVTAKSALQAGRTWPC